MSASRTRMPRVEPAQRGPAHGHRQRREQADRDEGEADAEQLDDQRREQAAGRHAEREDRLEAREHARQDGLVGQPGEQREAADVDQRVADADHAEQDDRRRLLGNDADQGQRRAEQRDADAEPAGEPAAPDQPEREERAEHAAGADGRVQDADARIARVQELDRDDDGEHGQAAARERLHDPEPRDQREPAIGRDRREALEHLAAAAAGGLRSRRRVVRERDDDQAGQQRHGGARREDRRPARSPRAGRPRRSGPPSVASESSMPRTAFALVSSCGDFANAGSRAECAGRYSAMATVATTARPYVAAAGPSAAVTAAAPPSIAARTMPTQTRTRSRRTRSAIVARNGASSAAAAMRAAGDGADRGDAAVAERHDAERDHERALARPHRRERDLGAAERPAVRTLSERARPVAEPRTSNDRSTARLLQSARPLRPAVADAAASARASRRAAVAGGSGGSP